MSNTSGHYAPGPAYLWQVVKQMAMLGHKLDFKVEVYDVNKRLTAATFLDAMNPAEDSRWFDPKWAVDELDASLTDLARRALGARASC